MREGTENLLRHKVIKMVFDNIKNCKTYCGMHRNFEKAFDFIKKAVEENLPTGKYEIDGKDLFASVQEYDSKTSSKAESHKNYIDIQFIVTGKEIIKSLDIAKATPNTEYNAEKDVMFYESNEAATTVVLEDGEYMILFPHDVHEPGLCVETPSPVKKIVVKVKL